MSRLLGHDLGSYLREQRESAQMSLRQLSELAGISNPYLSQIERGLKKPSAEILQQLARGLQVSAESLYVRAGILDADHAKAAGRPGVLEAIASDARLTDRQRAVLVDVYTSFAGANGSAAAASAGPDHVPSGTPSAPPVAPHSRRPARSTGGRTKMPPVDTQGRSALTTKSRSTSSGTS